jgi:hypothetical protein
VESLEDKKRRSLKQYINSAMKGQKLVGKNAKKKGKKYMESGPSLWKESIPEKKREEWGW